MSLNGLDDPLVQEAYQAAIAEAGGWLILKYTSRDSVALLGKGKGSVHEARACLQSYPDKSPLYGILVYRRRKILIKYIPEGTSRLLLARTTVHFQDVLEKYSPYEALLEISTAEGLNDTSLAASFPLHTATPSVSSNRLDEITEDGEDPGPAARSMGGSAARTSPKAHIASQRLRSDRRTAASSERSLPSSLSIDSVASSAPPTSLLSRNLPSPKKTSVSQFLVRSESGVPSVTSLRTDSVPSMTEDGMSEVSVGETVSSASTVEPIRPSSSKGVAVQQTPTILAAEPTSPVLSTRSRVEMADSPSSNFSLYPSPSRERDPTMSRPSTSERSNYEYTLPDFLKPKVKLGPRPVTAAERANRPKTASVASLPSNYRNSFRKQEPPQNPPPPPPKSQTQIQAQRPLSPSMPASRGFSLAPPPIPESIDYNPRPMSRGSIKSLPSHKSSGVMTADKLRLMKAVELRKKQLRKSNPQISGWVPPGKTEVVPEVPQWAETGTQPPTEAVQDVPTKAEMVPAAMAAVDREPSHTVATPPVKADHGTDIAASNHSDADIEPQPRQDQREPDTTAAPQVASRTGLGIEPVRTPAPVILQSTPHAVPNGLLKTAVADQSVQIEPQSDFEADKKVDSARELGGEQKDILPTSLPVSNPRSASDKDLHAAIANEPVAFDRENDIAAEQQQVEARIDLVREQIELPGGTDEQAQQRTQDLPTSPVFEDTRSKPAHLDPQSLERPVSSPRSRSPALAIPGAFLDASSSNESESGSESVEQPQSVTEPAQESKGEHEYSAVQPKENGEIAQDPATSQNNIPAERPKGIDEPMLEPAELKDEIKATQGKVDSPNDKSDTLPYIVTTNSSQPITPIADHTNDDESRSTASDVEGKSGDESTSSAIDLAAAWEMSPKRKNSDLARRRQGFVEPLQTDNTTDTEYSDDDFMDELHDAEVQEARPIMVSRSVSSPMQESFPRRPVEVRRPSAPSDVSDQAITPTMAEFPNADDASPASTAIPISLAPPVELKREPPKTYRPTAPNLDTSGAPLGARRVVSNGISQRIQALAAGAGTSTANSNTMISRAIRPTSPEIPRSAVASSIASTQSQNTSSNAFSRFPTRSTQSIQSVSPTIQPSSPQPSNGPTWTVKHDPTTKRDSVSVSARIVRPTPVEDEDSVEPPPRDNTFHQSKISVSHVRSTSVASNSISHARSTSAASNSLPRADTKMEMRPDSATKENFPPPTQPSIVKEPPKITIDVPQAEPPMSPPLESVRPITITPPATAASLPSPSSASTLAPSINNESSASKSSRTSRFFKRMSHMSGGGRRQAMQNLPFPADGRVNGAAPATKSPSPPISSLGPPISEGTEAQSILPAVVIGDLNIQFPDSLLWKRRLVSITSTGDLQLSQTDTQQQARFAFHASTRNFPLKNFKCPYTPDLDSQELPNSIMLDIVATMGNGDRGKRGDEAGTLQIACEDSVTHAQVVHVLRSYWRAWTKA